MSIDIRVVIKNYVPTDTYKVNIYRRGSIIPLATKDVEEHAGAIVTFAGLAEGYEHDAEVIHNCPDDTTSKTRIAVMAT